MFTEYFTMESAIVREICNGIMCVSAILLVAIFSDYILRRCYKDSASCFSDSAVQAAVVILVLLVGHAIRAFSGWMQFLWVRNDWEPNFWANTLWLFLTATVLIVLGKVLMVYVFAPYKWRLCIACFTVFFAVAVPVLVAVVV